MRFSTLIHYKLSFLFSYSFCSSHFQFWIRISDPIYDISLKLFPKDQVVNGMYAIDEYFIQRKYNQYYFFLVDGNFSCRSPIIVLPPSTIHFRTASEPWMDDDGHRYLAKSGSEEPVIFIEEGWKVLPGYSIMQFKFIIPVFTHFGRIVSLASYTTPLGKPVLKVRYRSEKKDEERGKECC